MEIALRIDVIEDKTPDDVYRMLYEFVMLYSSEYVITQEAGTVTGKIHFHVYMKTPSTTKFNTVRQQWKRKFSQWDGRRQQKSISEVKDRETYLKYICKDGFKKALGVDASLYVNQWTDPKQYGRTMLGRLQKYAVDHNETLTTHEDCLKIVFRYTKEHGNCMNKYRMKDQAMLLYSNINPDDCLDDFLSWAKI